MASQRSKLAAKVNNQFGLQLYNSINKHVGSDDNIFFSPLSITMALTMTYMGARGDTAKQIESVMKLESVGIDIHHALKNLRSDLIPIASSLRPPWQFKLANRLYGQKSFTFLPEFLTSTRDLYNAQLEAVDFVTETEATREAINSWVEEQTEGKIQQLLAPGVLSPDSRMVLINALYFKGEWQEQFEEYNTRDLPFHILTSNTVTVPMMCQKAKFSYYHDKTRQCRVLAMDYKGHKVNMVVALPDEIDGLAKLEANINKTVMKSWKGNLKQEKCIVTFPKFKFTKSFSLVDHLTQMGMSDLFQDGKADLSGIAKDELVVSEVVHKAFLDVNETGTEAAAATAAMLLTCGMIKKEKEPKIFKADHPFIFFICDNSSGVIIFMGRVTCPVIG